MLAASPRTPARAQSKGVEDKEHPDSAEKLAALALENLSSLSPAEKATLFQYAEAKEKATRLFEHECICNERQVRVCGGGSSFFRFFF